jgi:hypothetical protein
VRRSLAGGFYKLGHYLNESNGIVVGDNIKMLVPTLFYSPVCSRPGKENNRYIFTIPEENLSFKL